MRYFNLNRKHEMFLNDGGFYSYKDGVLLNRKHEMFLNVFVNSFGLTFVLT